MPTLLPKARTPEAAFVVCAAALVLTQGVILLFGTNSGLRSGMLEVGVALDLALGLPLLGHLFIVQTGRASRDVLLPLAATGLALSGLLIFGSAGVGPIGWQGVPWEAILIALEGTLLLVALLSLPRIRRRYRELRNELPHGSDAMRRALEEGLGRRLGAIAFGEASLLWYGLTGWGRGPKASAALTDAPGPPGHGAVVGALVLLAIVETTTLHLIVHLGSPPVAWFLTATSVYGILWLLADVHASRIVPTRFGPSGLHLRVGLRWRLDVEWDQIAGVHLSEPEGESLSTAFLRSPDLWVEFCVPQRLRGAMGITKPASVVGLSAANPRELRERLSRYLRECDPPGME